MNCLRYWARYVRKREVKSGGIKNGNESTQIVLCISFFILIIFKSIIQFLFVYYFHYYCVCTNKSKTHPQIMLLPHKITVNKKLPNKITILRTWLFDPTQKKPMKQKEKL